MKKLLVVGSINIDLFFDVNNMPKIGETIISNSMELIPGGKGANQAVAASKFGIDVTFLGCVSNDSFGKQMLKNLEDKGINTKHIKVVENQMTGLAVILSVDGDNSIIVDSGANNLVDDSYIFNNREVISKQDLILIQNEIPESALRATVEIAKEFDIEVIYNPAPVKHFSKDISKQVTYVTPNHHEAIQFDKDQKNLIITLGNEGVDYNGHRSYPPKVEVVDSTGAGDAFNGALCALLLKEYPIEKAIEYACIIASLSVEKKGAQPHDFTIDYINKRLTELEYTNI